MIKRIINSLRSLNQRIFGIYSQTRNLKYDLRRQYLEDKIMNSDKIGVTEKKYCEHEIIVSLTTYGKRLQDVCFTIESIMQQTMLPNKIILNLDPTSQSQPLPISLKKQISRGLVVVVVVDDIKSYKKLIPTLKDYPDSIIITVDDDALYDFDIVERLFNSYLENPTKVSALRTHTIKFDKDKKPLKYNDWDWCSANTENPYHLFATGVGGVLYPPHCFPDEVFNQEVFTNICRTADDVWFHAMEVLNGTEIVRVPSRSSLGENYIINEDVQDVGLVNINTGSNGQNDNQISAVYEKYGIYDLLRN
ncbi:MAG: hypothetical protein NC453_08815 [Muribaculum sp.]|nr:hypothetical protein [Muribaculum sp.]